MVSPAPIVLGIANGAVWSGKVVVQGIAVVAIMVWSGSNWRASGAFHGKYESIREKGKKGEGEKPGDQNKGSNSRWDRDSRKATRCLDERRNGPKEFGFAEQGRDVEGAKQAGLLRCCMERSAEGLPRRAFQEVVGSFLVCRAAGFTCRGWDEALKR
ncbi:hypothetical protein B0H10DRAFT_1939945 [Mycena sp. CBHHK59/15]|nr:hypothetical protein B0H10DRAFT_1939945 [Mycena sp. CBHHK59/15]